MARASERIAYAVDMLDVQPQDRLLELGCVTAGLDADGFRVERVDRRAASPAAVVSVVASPTD